ncbi:MAG: TraE/TraK family type IV conjugative transfer system protein [Methylophilus sp.]|uniref:TraE/TraK family type IV conjugative transfer system protein n=1 Tax=Methylophilus sp. TaxID=29541 RepID=UPI003F9F83F0
MIFKSFQKTYNTIIAENNFYRFIIFFLMLFLLIAMMGWLGKENTTVLVPPTLNEKAEISNKSASATYKKSWALFIAELLGNVTPGNSDFVLSSIQPLLASDVYQNVTNGMRQEVAVMKRDAVTVQFHPRSVSYETTTNKCFVTGRTSILASTGEISSFDRTYEVEVSIRAGRPVIAYLDSYVGNPHTSDVVDRMNKNQQMKQNIDRANESKKQSDERRELEQIKEQVNPEETIE